MLLSPSSFKDNMTYSFLFEYDEFHPHGWINIVEKNVETESHVRPAINLISGITITSGDGTQSNPYVIE